MIAFISFLSVALAVIAAIPVIVFLVEVVAAVALPQCNSSAPLDEGTRLPVGVMVPAHNESIGLLRTLTDIKAQLHAGDRLLVVADNCSDDTAAIAAAAGADVCIRNDPDRKGKGYALAWGIEHLSKDPPDFCPGPGPLRANHSSAPLESLSRFTSLIANHASIQRVLKHRSLSGRFGSRWISTDRTNNGVDDAG